MNLVRLVAIAAATADLGSNGGVAIANEPADVAQSRAETVVRDQLRHFSRWQTDPQAAPRAFALASPENRERLGSVEQFQTLLESPRYRPLIDNRGWLCGESAPVENGRTLLVTTIDRSGRLAVFRYYVRPDASEPESAWAIDAVVRVPLEDGIEPGGES